MHDLDLIEVAKEFREGILGGRSSRAKCAYISIPLAGLLRVIYGVECECVQSDLTDNDRSEFFDHVWIKLADGRALDATLDQFGHPERVYLGPPTKFHANPEPIA